MRLHDGNRQCQFRREPHTNIGDSEYTGGETTYCTLAGRTSLDQGVLPDNFWRNVEYKADNGVNGYSYVQRTCFELRKAMQPLEAFF
jgi:hypothetical protein